MLGSHYGNRTHLSRLRASKDISGVLTDRRSGLKQILIGRGCRNRTCLHKLLHLSPNHSDKPLHSISSFSNCGGRSPPPTFPLTEAVQVVTILPYVRIAVNLLRSDGKSLLTQHSPKLYLYKLFKLDAARGVQDRMYDWALRPGSIFYSQHNEVRR